MTGEAEVVLRAVRGLIERKESARLVAIAEASLKSVPKTADALGQLIREGLIQYNLKTGFTLKSTPKTEATEAPSKPLVESPPSYSGGIGGRAVGARTLFPLSFQTISDLSQKKYERMQKTDKNRQEVRDRLRQLAQETTEKLTRRPLASLDDPKS